MTRHVLFVLGLVPLLVVGAPVGGVSPPVGFHSTGEPATSPAPTVSTIPIRNVTAVDAMVAAQETTNGTAIGVEREREDQTPVWEVEVLRRDGARFEVDIHAVTGAVRHVENGSVFGGGASEGLLPANRTRNVSEMRSAIEAVRVAQNQSVTVSNVTEVSLDIENATLVYEIECSTLDGEVHVAAVPGQEFDRTTVPVTHVGE